MFFRDKVFGARVLVLVSIAIVAPLPALSAEDSELTPIEELGKAIFFDTNLSQPEGQACASCHSPETGFTGPSSVTFNPGAVEPGAVAGRFGNRKPPSVTYAAFSPVFYFDKKEKLYVGGQFWDGRATTLKAQAGQPFLNPLEMNNASPKELCDKVSKAFYYKDFRAVFGNPLDCSGGGTVGLNSITAALAAYERSNEVNPFTSKFDYFLKGETDLSPTEKRGLELFESEKKGNCAACHPSTSQSHGVPPMFTDFTYDNVGLPANPDNPFLGQDARFNPYGRNWQDRGLANIVGDDSLAGAFKVPSLRNAAKVPARGFTRAYGHNGVLKSLKEVVRFYNTRDVVGAGWAAPEYPATMNTEELGDLKLTEAEVDAIVAFLHTLTDGFDLKRPHFSE
ncbi:MAG: c-type cytochrome [Alphaproteobacteria bacterium]|nr:c-type cytochrome [Alphaproteobacteria bacterium]